MLKLTRRHLAAYAASAFLIVSALSPIPASAETYYCFCAEKSCAMGENSVGGTIDITGDVTEGSANEAKLRTDCNQMCSSAGKASCGTSTTPPTGSELPTQGVCPPGATCLRNPLGTTSIPAIVGRIISAALGVVGAIAFLMFVYGGFLWLTSGGSSEQVKKGQEAMKWASIGLIIIFSSYGLVQLVFRAVTGPV